MTGPSNAEEMILGLEWAKFMMDLDSLEYYTEEDKELIQKHKDLFFGVFLKGNNVGMRRMLDRVQERLGENGRL